MQRVEIKDWQSTNIFCPFCGKAILQEDGVDWCEHTLFVATDAGFEYINKNIPSPPDGVSIDKFTNSIEFPESFKLAIYKPAPSHFGVYLGFSLSLEQVES